MEFKLKDPKFKGFDVMKDELPEWDLKSTVDKMDLSSKEGDKEMGEIPTLDTGNDVLDTASQGASLGASLGKLGAVGGPWGAAIGAVAGGILGGLKARSKRKAANRKATADMYMQKGHIEAITQANRQAALGGLASRLSSALR